MTIATNPETGEVQYLDDSGAWQPAKTAVNPDTHEMMAFDGKEWKAVPASKGVFNYIDDAVRSLASGVTFGYADEIAAKLDELTGRNPRTLSSLVSGDGKSTYEVNLARERARDAQIPLAIKIPGEVAGSVGATIAAAPAVAGAAAAALPARVLQTLKGLPELVKYLGLGAAEGAAAGSGGATEGNRLEGAATGAAVGGAVGAAAPYVVRGVQNVVSAVTPKSTAAADLGRAIVRDEDSALEVARRLGQARGDRPDATIADVAGENVRGLIERVAQTPGAGRTQVVPTLTARQEQQADRIVGDLRNLTGTNRTASQAIEQTIEQRATAAKPLYDEAFKFDANAAPEVIAAFEKATATGFGRDVLNSKALKSALQTEYGVDDIAQVPKMVLIDAWKKAVDDVIGTAKNQGQTNAVRVLSKMRDGVVEVVDVANPAYAKARNAWAGPSAYLDAINEGRGILSRDVSADEFAANFAKLSDADKEAARIGAVSAVVARVGNDAAKLADLTKYLRSDEMRKKVAAIMPDADTAAAWARRLDYEVRSSEMTGRALGNSATYRRTAEAEDAKGIPADLVMSALRGQQTLLGLILNAGAAVPRWLRDTVRSRADKELGQVLTDPARAGELPRVLSQAAQQQRGTPRGAASTTAAGVSIAE